MQAVTTPNVVAIILFVIASVLMGAAWLCTVLIHAKVIRSTALPQASIWNLWSQVTKVYPSVCPGGRLLFWRTLLQVLGLCSFVAMMIVLLAVAIMSKTHS